MHSAVCRRTPALPILVVFGVLIVVRAGTGVTARVSQSAPPDARVSAELKATLMEEGQVVYGRDCAECHAEGGIGQALGGNSALKDTDKVITRILKGSADGAMAAFGPSLTDREVAAVSTFIRNTWDNAFGAVVESDVKRVRASLRMW